MNLSLTISTLVFNQLYSDKAGSERRETSRGLNLPEVMLIKHRDTVDAKNGITVQQSLVQFDRVMLLSNGKYFPVTGKLTLVIPKDSAVEAADVTSVVARFAQVIQGANSGLDLADEIFVNREQ
jgi:hypothetical protein